MTASLAVEPLTIGRAPDADPPYDDVPPPLPRAAVLGPVDGRFPAVRAPLRLVPPVPEETFASARAPGCDVEDPAPRAAMLARAVLETLAGDRALGQLERWATPEVLDVLAPLAATRPHRPWAATLRRVMVREPLPGIAEVTAVVQRGTRAGALALRMEAASGRWVVTALQLG